MVIRPRTDADRDALLALTEVVHVVDGYPMVGAHNFERFLFGHAVLDAWVAEVDGVVVGHVALHPHTSAAVMEFASRALDVREDSLGVVARLFVSPDVRGRGIGEALLNTATAEASARGLRPVLDVNVEMSAAVALYERCGWRRLGMLTVTFGEAAVDEYVYAPD